MATQVATLARPAHSASAGLVLPAFTLWWREIVRFYRQPTRVVGVLASPLVFWLVIGSGFGTSFRSGGGPGQQHYLDYFYPGALIMIVLFTSIFTMMSVIEDRKEGFLLSVLVAPVPRSAIVLGKVLRNNSGCVPGDDLPNLCAICGSPSRTGASAVGSGRRLSGLFFTDRVGLRDRVAHGFIASLPWNRQSLPDSFVAVSGALFPLAGASGWIRIIMRLNPLTYGVEALRGLLYPGAETTFPLPSAMATLLLFSLVMFGAAFLMANRRTTRPAA